MTYTPQHAHRGHDRIRRLSGFGVAVVATAIALHWAWNTAGVELFGMPAARLIHVVAAEAAMLAVMILFRATSNAPFLFRHARDR